LLTKFNTESINNRENIKQAIEQSKDLFDRKYIEFIPRERKIGVEPGNKWRKPSAVLISEGNYSDAHMFPVVYKTLGIGKLVGMPVAGTGTAVYKE
jgi:C-terminal processing protease CtpA/Prc